MTKTTIIIGIWRHRLNLNGLHKPDNIRIIVVGPANLLVDETNVDVVHQVEGPITSRDTNHYVLIQKIRELCAGLTNTTKRLCVFERCLQREIAQIRREMDIDGITPEQLDSLIHKKDMKIVCKRSGISTLRFCSFASVQGQPDAWIECAKTRVGSYPMFLRPVNVDNGCMHMLHIARNADDLRSWIRTRPKTSNYCVEYLVEECLENGHEFVAIASNKTGLIGTFTTLDPKNTFFTSVKNQNAYAIEYLTAEQTRDALPGVESFIMQSMKTVFSRSMNNLIFIKGFYKDHNSITFLSASLELRRDTLAKLFIEANHGKTWESVAVETLFENINRKTLENGYQNSYTMVVNFPISEGILIHQTAIARRKSRMRVAWRVAEGEELLDADSIDDNVLQIFVSNSDRKLLLEDIQDIIEKTDITVDKSCLVDKHTVCRRVTHATRVSSSGNKLIRSTTTTD